MITSVGEAISWLSRNDQVATLDTDNSQHARWLSTMLSCASILASRVKMQEEYVSLLKELIPTNKITVTEVIDNG